MLLPKPNVDRDRRCIALGASIARHEMAQPMDGMPPFHEPTLAEFGIFCRAMHDDPGDYRPATQGSSEWKAPGTRREKHSMPLPRKWGDR